MFFLFAVDIHSAYQAKPTLSQKKAPLLQGAFGIPLCPSRSWAVDYQPIAGAVNATGVAVAAARSSGKL